MKKWVELPGPTVRDSAEVKLYEREQELSVREQRRTAGAGAGSVVVADWCGQYRRRAVRLDGWTWSCRRPGGQIVADQRARSGMGSICCGSTQAAKIRRCGEDGMVS